MARIARWQKNEEDVAFEKAQSIRNHGLFSKAEKALKIAGWSERARRDIEIFPLVGRESFTLLLRALNHTAQSKRLVVCPPQPDGEPGTRAALVRAKDKLKNLRSSAE